MLPHRRYRVGLWLAGTRATGLQLVSRPLMCRKACAVCSGTGVCVVCCGAGVCVVCCGTGVCVVCCGIGVCVVGQGCV